MRAKGNSWRPQANAWGPKPERIVLVEAPLCATNVVGFSDAEVISVFVRTRQAYFDSESSKFEAIILIASPAVTHEIDSHQ